MNCWKCGKSGATIPDPCCNAPDCEHKDDYAHFECLDTRAQKLEREWWEE